MKPSFWWNIWTLQELIGDIDITQWGSYLGITLPCLLQDDRQGGEQNNVGLEESVGLAAVVLKVHKLLKGLNTNAVHLINTTTT